MSGEKDNLTFIESLLCTWAVYTSDNINIESSQHFSKACGIICIL